MAKHVSDIVRDLLKDKTVRAKVPYVPPPSQSSTPKITFTESPGPVQEDRHAPRLRQEPSKPPVRKEKTTYAPIHQRRTDTTHLRLVDHTVEIDGEIGAGYLVRERGVDIGYVWCIQSAWRWTTPSKDKNGTANTKRAACEALQELHAEKGGA